MSTNLQDLYQKFRIKLLPLLSCTQCRGESLQLRTGAIKVEVKTSQLNEHIFCGHCGERYPITEDVIPLMWTPALREYFLGQSNQLTNLNANIEIYNAISDNYYAFTRQEIEIAQRIQNAVKTILERSNDQHLHLDFGCGPGHVLNWLKSLGFTQVGLDVSLKNLRNTRINTGALVVLGDATRMPFKERLFHLITESSTLHHIENWQAAIAESCRVCREKGHVLIDAEPTKERMAWSPLAVAVFNARFPIYKLLSYVWKKKYLFRTIKQAKLNLRAEIHNQPGTGFPLTEVKRIFEQSGLSVDIILSPTPDLESRAQPDWKDIVLNLLSLRNPWNPRYGGFTGIAKK